jgi:hypothetical protein
MLAPALDLVICQHIGGSIASSTAMAAWPR